MGSHNTLTGTNLHLSKVRTGTGNPNTTLAAATYVGDVYMDDSTGTWYVRKTNTGTDDWVAAFITHVGAHTVSMTTTGNTSITLPTSGTLSTTSGSETLTGKTIDADLNTITNIENADIKAGAAIDAAKLADGSVSNTEFQYINSLSSNAQDQLTANATAISDHIADATDAHDASAISSVASGNLSATDVQGALNELQTDIDTRAPSATAVTLTGTQVLTNKDYDGGTASNTSRTTLPKDTYANLLLLTRKEGTMWYATDLDKVFYDDGATLQEVGSGSGTSSFVENFNFENGNVDGWVTYVNAAGTTPVDGTGGTATSTFAINSTTPMFGTYDGKFSKPASNEQGEGFSVDFTIPNYLKGKAVNIRIPTNVSSGYVSGDMGYYVYDVTNGGTPYKVGNITGSGDFVGFFIASSTSSSYRLIAHVQTTGTVAFDVNVDEVFVGKEAQFNGAAITDWQTYSPTGSWGNCTYTGKWKQVGKDITLRIGLTLTGAPTGTLSFTAAQLLNGLGLTYDATANASNANKMPYGKWAGVDTGTADYTGTFTPSDATSATPSFFLVYGATSLSSVNATTPFTWGSGDEIGIEVTFSIAEFSSNTTMANRALENFYSDDGANDVFGANGSLVPNQSATTNETERAFTIPENYSTDFLALEINYRGFGWSLMSDMFPFSGGNNASSSNFYGVRGRRTSATVYTVGFGNQGTRVSASNTSAGASDWATEYAAGTRFRLRDTRGGALVGYPIGARNIVGDTTGVAVPLGLIGQVIKTTAMTNTAITTSLTDVTGASLPLTPGVWLIKYTLEGEVNTGASAGSRSIISMNVYTSANVLVDDTGSRVAAKSVAAVSDAVNAPLSGSTVVTLSAPETYKLRGILTNISGTGSSTAIITSAPQGFYAVRIA